MSQWTTKCTNIDNKKIVIAGGSGFVGMALARRWQASNEVVILSRQSATQVNNSFGMSEMAAGVKYVQWDGKTVGAWAETLDGADVVVNLAGRSVNCRYTDVNKAEIMNSRVEAVNALAAAIHKCTNAPKLFIQMASATIYRHAEDRAQDEYTVEIENDFSVQVCKAWEQAVQQMDLPGTRKVILRTAIVLGHGGVLVPYSWLAKLGAGGQQGSGRQMFSWVHIDDVGTIMEWMGSNENADGVYNVSAPGPVTNAEFMSCMRAVYHMPIGLPAPEWLVKLGAMIQGTEAELLLKSRWVMPARLLKEGYRFEYNEIDAALRNLLPLKLVSA